jgi:hypothetical protein
MKYAKELQKQLIEMPDELRIQSINYKKWKKQSRLLVNADKDIQDALSLLEKECEKVDKVFRKEYRKHNNNQSLFSVCYRPKANVRDAQNLLKFARINSKTVYKICKKLSKILHANATMQWLCQKRSVHQYSFMGSQNTTFLELKTKNFVVECPFCMEDDRKKLLVFSCGHYGCLDCVLRYADVHMLNGTWHNLLSYSNKKKCPVCRFDNALIHGTCVSLSK